MMPYPPLGRIPSALGARLIRPRERRNIPAILRASQFGCTSAVAYKRYVRRAAKPKWPLAGALSEPISRVLSRTTIYLGRTLPHTSLARNPNARKGSRIALLFALAPDGVYQAVPLLARWCALTAPFQLFSQLPTGVFFSVALSVESPRPAVSWHLALWSPDFPH